VQRRKYDADFSADGPHNAAGLVLQVGLVRPLDGLEMSVESAVVSDEASENDIRELATLEERWEDGLVDIVEVFEVLCV
jgi:hypothetical protein